MGWLPNKCSFLSLSSDAVNVCDHTQSLKMNVTVCFGRGAGEAGCSCGRLCRWVAVGAEGGHVLVPPLSLPASAGSAAGVQAWAAIAQGQFCGHGVP